MFVFMIVDVSGLGLSPARKTIDFKENLKGAYSFKILNSENEYILRFEIILNNMDIDQIIDIKIYLEMLINILKAVHNKFNIVFKFTHNLEYETKKYLELRKRNKK